MYSPSSSSRNVPFHVVHVGFDVFSALLPQDSLLSRACAGAVVNQKWKGVPEPVLGKSSLKRYPDFVCVRSERGRKISQDMRAGQTQIA